MSGYEECDRGDREHRWEREVLEPALKKRPSAAPFTTISGRPIDRLYTEDDLTSSTTPAT